MLRSNISLKDLPSLRSGDQFKSFCLNLVKLKVFKDLESLKGFKALNEPVF